MALVSFFIHLMSAATLLLFSVRFLRIGIERLWRSRIQASMKGDVTYVSTMLRGAGLGFAMQGATAVALMSASLSTSGTIPAIFAVLLIIGADLGSSVAVVILTSPVSELGPLVILCGGWLYLNSTASKRRNVGRVILGLGLIFLSLAAIRSAVEPLAELSASNAALDYISTDLVTAFLVGCAAALLMHSSLAAVLSVVALGSQGLIAVSPGLSIVLGANAGSALLPLWLLRREIGEGIVAIRSVAIIRLSFCALVLVAVSQVNLPTINLPIEQTLLIFHVLFNAILVCSAPLAPLVVKCLTSGRTATEINPRPPIEISDDPEVAVASLKGQVSRMLGTLETMLIHALNPALDTSALTNLEREMNAGLGRVRDAYASLHSPGLYESSEVHALLDFAIRIEACGDIIAGPYLAIRSEHNNGLFEFSAQGREEIEMLGSEVVKGLQLAQSTFWKWDPRVATSLLHHKKSVRDREEESRRQHFHRVRTGNVTSQSSSNQHLELIAALKSINSKLATIGYAVLDEHGALRKSRLKKGFEDVD